MKNHHQLALACAFAVFTASGIASAADTWSTDYKMLSGAQCQPSHGSQWPDFVVNPTGIRNTTTSNRYISCTYVLDSDVQIDQSDNDSSTAAGSAIVGLGFDYSQVSPAATPTTNCTFFNHHFLGAVTSENVSVTSGKTTTTVYNTWAPTVLNGLSTNHGTLSFNCRLPPKVKLVWVYLGERGSTSGYRYVP